MTGRQYFIDAVCLSVQTTEGRPWAAMCMDADSGQVLGSGYGGSREDVVIQALGSAVVSAGIPESIMLDNALPIDAVECFCATHSIRIERLVPHSAEPLRAVEKMFRGGSQE